jgi:hypothetical protein
VSGEAGGGHRYPDGPDEEQGAFEAGHEATAKWAAGQSREARYRAALEEILAEVRKPPFTMTGRKAWIRDVSERALEREFDGLDPGDA